MVNAPLLEDTMAHIRDNPELHNQSFYYEMAEFGLTACFAGRSLILAGYTPVITRAIRGDMAEHPATGMLVSVWTEARDLLGLNDRWATNLFTPTNTRQMLELKVKDLLNGSPLDWHNELLSVGS